MKVAANDDDDDEEVRSKFPNNFQHVQKINNCQKSSFYSSARHFWRRQNNAWGQRSVLGYLKKEFKLTVKLQKLMSRDSTCSDAECFLIKFELEMNKADTGSRICGNRVSIDR